jgi:hypothetical protein
MATAAILVLTIAPSASAADAAKEIATAADHAGYAADATIVTTTHSHLHHTVNCLVGPKGKGFDAKEANPCASMGNGAIPDTTDAMKKTSLESALAKAKAGLAAKDLATAKADAMAAQELLKKAM